MLHTTSLPLLYSGKTLGRHYNKHPDNFTDICVRSMAETECVVRGLKMGKGQKLTLHSVLILNDVILLPNDNTKCSKPQLCSQPAFGSNRKTV